MFAKLKLLLELFKNGKALANKEMWRRQQAYVVPVVLSLLLGCVELARTFNIQILLDETTCNYIALVVYGVVNTCLSVMSSTKLGYGSGVEQSDMPSAEQAVLELPEAPQGIDEQEPLPTINEHSDAVTEASGRFQDDTLERAREWLARNAKPTSPFNEVN